MIKVTSTWKRGLLLNTPHQTFIVKNPKKIEWYKELKRRGGLMYLEIEEIDGTNI